MPQHTENPKVEDLSTDPARTNITNRQSLLKEIKSKWMTITTFMISAYHQYACSVHENCNGMCGGAFRQEASFILPEATMLSLLMATVSPQKQNATREEGPHDTAWMEARDFSKHTYSDIESSTGEIRLLKLKKGIFRSDIVECEMITTSLDNPSKYNALSYCWGTGGATEVMLVDGRTHFIYGSLNSALKAYREGVLQDTPLWIDAVSINQENRTEKSQQILLMRQIYSKATTVFVYLGKADRSWFTGLDLANLLYVMDGYSKTAKDQVADIIHDIVPNFQHPSWSYFLDTFSSPWFCRTWILQEIALCKDARVCKGLGVTGWEVLAGAYNFLLNSSLGKNIKKFFSATKQGENVSRAMVNVRRMVQIKQITRSPTKTSLMTILSMTRHFEASDPRDKVLGLLGLLTELPEGLETIVNYDLSVSQIYHKVAIYFVQCGIPHALLDQAGLQRQSQALDIPSWVPDWNASNQEISRPLTQFRMTTFNATNSEGPLLGFFETPKKLGGVGFFYHTITRLSEMKKSSGEPIKIQDQLRAMKRCYEESNDYAYDDADEAFARTLLIDDLHTGRNAIPTMTPIHNLMPAFQSVMKYLDAHNQVSDRIEVLEGATPDEVDSYHFQAHAATHGRRFAVTDTGHMALVAERTEVGDAVAFVMGTRVPYTLQLDLSSKRLVGPFEQIHARLIGDCYMHGMMEGEVFEDAKLRKQNMSGIVLV